MRSRKVLVVDDEQIARDRVRRFLLEIDPHTELQQASNGFEALHFIAEFKPDIIYLDIEMPGLNGFEVLQQLETRTFQVVFQTAYDEYAIKAFEESACDYLLKPFSKERIAKSFSKALLMQDQAVSLRKLSEHHSAAAKFLDKLTYKLSGKIKVIETEQIAYFLSQDHCTCAYDLTGQEYIVDFSITALEERLDPKLFVRCHRNSLVQIRQIHTLGSTTDSTVTLRSGTTLPVSRSQRPKVLEKLLG